MHGGHARCKVHLNYLTEFQAAWASFTEYRQNFRQLGQVVQNTDKISGSWDKLYRVQTEFQTAWASCTVYRQNFRQLGQVVQNTEYRQNFRQLGQVVQNTDRISGSWDKLYRIQTEFQAAGTSCTEYSQNNTAKQRSISNASSPS